MRDRLGEHLFTFAVLTDSHVNEEEGKSASPYRSNRRANARLRWVVRELNRLEPAFVVHLGDMANPIPELATYGAAAANFKAIAGKLQAPLHCLPGNHCVGDKPVGWVPVPRVSNRALEAYEGHYGFPHHYSFDFGPCHFVALDSLLINSGLKSEGGQRRWLEGDLAAAGRGGKRLFVLMHYPAFVAAPDERDSYDNLDEPGRTWLLDLLERHRVEAAYSGHVHNYFYNRYGDTHLYTLPATSFVRHDYAELFQVAPEDDEGGRNDVAKLGYCVVKVYERGHVNHVIRTYGRVLDGGGGDREEPSAWRIGAVSARQGPLAPLGIEMRENWLAQTALRANNSVSPFTRRTARNDWSILALQEMGIRRIRVAQQELVKEDVLERMTTLQAAGYEFTVYSHGIPREREYRVVRRNRALLAGWELILDLDQVESVARGIARLESGLSDDGAPPCYLNEVHGVSRDQIDDANVKHVANYGFQPHEGERIAKLSQSTAIRETFTGLVFRVRRRGEPELSPWEAIREIGRLGAEHGMRHHAHLLFSGNVTAEPLVDDLDTANRVAEATLAAVAAGNVDLTFDTFEDVDRGYFVRTGLVDRRYNPRMAARVVRHLNAALARWDAWEIDAAAVGPGLLTCLSAGRLLALVTPRKVSALDALEAPAAGEWSSFTVVDLDTGALAEVAAATTGTQVRFGSPLSVAQPTLLIGER